jgi:hypothetical protein
MDTLQVVQSPPEKEMDPFPLLASVLPSVVPVSTYTSVPLAVQTVWPVSGLEAQEFTTSGVVMRVGTTLLPSTLTTDTSVVKLPQLPLGTYETTFVPVTSTDSELADWQEPGGGGWAPCTLKLSVLELECLKLAFLESQAL